MPTTGTGIMSDKSEKKGVEPRCIKYGPPEKSPEKLRELEKGFVLDCVAVSTFSDDLGHSSPKLSTAIPPYNAQRDKHASRYFQIDGVRKTLKVTEQANGGESINGKQVDRFYERGRMGKYIESRNNEGAGHSTEEVSGHGTFMTNINPVNGFNGPFGFRRNTPWLRNKPSVFEGKIDSRSVVP